MSSSEEDTASIDTTLSSIPFQDPVLIPSKFVHFIAPKTPAHNIEQGWITLDNKVPTVQDEGNKIELRRFSVVQWNVWFDSKWLVERSKVILAHLLFLKPSIIALQEVTATFSMMIFKEVQIQKDYIVTDFRKQLRETGSSYGVMVLVRKELVEACSGEVETWEVESGEQGMKSRMGRVIVGVDLGGGLNIRFATAHFESPPSSPASRIHQFKLSSLLPMIPSTIFHLPDLTMVCGDTNCITPNELPHAFGTTPESPWRDAFEQVHPGEDGYTCTLTYPDQYPLARFDRMMYYPAVGDWEARECETFGSDIAVERREIKKGVCIEDQRGKDRRVWASDHEGLRTVFCLGEET